MRYILIFVLLLLAGCGGEPKLVPAGGIVTLNGKPLQGANVTFVPGNEGEAAAARTDKEGRFSLNTKGTPGAATGEYRVTISKLDVSGLEAGGTVKSQRVVPLRYGNKNQSGLTASVKLTGNDFTFDLVSP